MELNGFALVTGAGSGIGRACAHAYATEGAAGVAFADVNLTSAQNAMAESIALAKHPSYRAIVVEVDIVQEASVYEMISATIQAFGRIDYAVNCAGIGVQKPTEISESSTDEFNQFLQVNIFGMFLSVRAEARAMKKQEAQPASKSNPKRGSTRGVIINMGSCSSYCATAQMTQYTTTKHAVLGLTKNAALDCAKSDIRVNCLCPSWVDTPMVQQAIAGNPALEPLMRQVIPMKRIAQADEIADVVMFLSSPRASYVTGCGWIVDGGTTLSVTI